MLAFLKERSYDIVRMFLYQVAIAIFGISLAIATGSKSTSTDLVGYQPATLQIVTSVFSIAFYLFLVCHLLWEIGVKDANRISENPTKPSRLTGLYMGLAASSLNFLIAVFITLGNFLSHIPFFGTLGAGAVTAGLLTEGMYMGLLAIRVNDVPLNSMWFMWFVIMIPMILSSTLAYIAGTREFCFFKPKK
ncbi:MAG: hypothetical protein IJW69_00435 [Clostridia bacterium]|nr:hypothetical protein [Clostridia bacterium]